MDWFELLENDDTSNRYHPPTLSFKEEDITVENMENYERRMSEILAELRAMGDSLTMSDLPKVREKVKAVEFYALASRTLMLDLKQRGIEKGK